VTLLDLAWDDLCDPVWLDVLATDDGELQLALLPELVERSDVIVGQYLDEELCAFSAVASDPDAHWTPWLAGQASEHRDVARAVVDRLHLADDVVTDVRDGTGLVQVDHQVVSDALDRARRQVVWTHHLDDAVVGRAGLLALDDTVMLHDLHDDNGIHLLVFRSADRARRLVADALSLRGVDGRSADVCHLHAGPVWRSADPFRSVMVCRSEEGLVATDSAAGDAAGVVDDAALGCLAASVLAV
jgi:hypothetical protein